MNTKKIAVMASFITALTYASFASAAAWTPLVRIPGLPATGAVDLSMYMVGLYNFLLSIVGIVAVMMLIIGGMRYITAAGNSAAIGDAKDIITNAIVGLLLALLSWVFIATINPDVLYIKQPGSSFSSSPVQGACHKEYDPVAFTCKCKDNFVALNPPYADAEECDDECRAIDHCGIDDPNPCIAPNSPPDFSSQDFITPSSPYYEHCKCIDGVFIEPIGGAADCNEACSDSTMASDLKYHGINWRLKIGNDVNGTMVVPKGENFTVEAGEPNYYDFSEVRDCKDNLIHFFIDFAGEPADYGAALLDPHRWCCMRKPANCSSTWGECCNAGGCLAGLINPPICSSLSEMNPIDGYPIFKHTYNNSGVTEIIWVGISVSTGGTNCIETEKEFMIDVVGP